MAVWLVADFEALSCQVTTTFDTSCAARIPTAPAINYTACYRLVFIVLYHFSINLLLRFCLPYMGTDTLFDKLWLLRWLVWLGNVCGCEGLAY
jgi:hypothetical protein